jgi:hypothetical protein
VAASPDTGVDTITGQGLSEVLDGARVVVDVSNAPDWDDEAVMSFFETSSRNLLAAEVSAGTGHHVALSVVGTDRLVESSYTARRRLDELIRDMLMGRDDAREVITDPHARYFGIARSERTLLPSDDARIGSESDDGCSLTDSLADFDRPTAWARIRRRREQCLQCRSPIDARERTVSG